MTVAHICVLVQLCMLGTGEKMSGKLPGNSTSNNNINLERFLNAVTKSC